MATEAQVAAHKAKMKRKAARVLVAGIVPMEDKRFAAARLNARLQGKGITFNHSSAWRLLDRGFSIAQVNRHTGKPHEHRREIARRTGLPQ
jgi:hypothetical protein